MNKPFVTVLINTINEVEERLKKTITSFKEQAGVKLQILISTIENDISIDIAKQMDCDVVINNEKGIYQQLNNAINYIKGDWWCYSSGHDLALPDKLVNEINCCIKNKRQICYSDYYLINPTTNEKKQIKFFEYDYNLHLQKGNFVNDCAIISTALTKKYVPFDYKLWNNDSHYDFWLRIFEGEGNVFCYNNIPSWSYIEYNDSKHILREKSEIELYRYKYIRKNMIASHTEKPLITVGLPTYQSKIIWLALEGLCNQKTNIKWEFIICEDEVGANGIDFFYNYYERLEHAGCVCIKYISVPRECEERDRMALSLKWRMIALASHKDSLGMLLQASDCYSEPQRIQTAYEQFNNGFDWINSRFGIFYHLKYSKTILFDMNTLDTKVGLNMGIKLDIARQLPDEIYYSSVDNWLYNSMLKIKPNAKIYTDLSDNWKQGIDTDGENIISKKRYENYFIARPPFVDTTSSVNECLPEYIVNLITKKNNVISDKIIEQCNVSRSVIFFEDKVFNKFGFKNKRIDKKKPFEIDLHKPLLIFGCYVIEDFQRALNHKSEVVILWAGSDSMNHNYEQMKQFINKKNIFHISGSKFISDDLEKVGLKYKYIPISLCNYQELKATPLGNKIYVYQSRGKNDPEFYGKSIIDKLILHYGRDRFIIACVDTYNKQELYKKYAECFIGLRLIKHDGLSETVAELGIMGRNVITNGDMPNSLQYQSIDDIINLIDTEASKIGTIQEDLSLKMRQYLNVGNEFLNVNYWKEKNENKPLINVLIRTHQRPTMFAKCIESLRNQTYKNINIIIGVEENDSETLNYVKSYGLNILKYPVVNQKQNKPNDINYGDWFPFNHYLDLLSQSITSEWIMQFDDDDILIKSDAIEQISDAIQTEDDLIMWRVKYCADRLIPSDIHWEILQQNMKPINADISGCGFCFNSKYKNQIEWGYFKKGDFRVANKLYYICKNKRFINDTLIGIQSIPNKGLTENQIIEKQTNKSINKNQIIMKIILTKGNYNCHKLGEVGQVLELEESTARALINKNVAKIFDEKLQKKIDKIYSSAEKEKKELILTEINDDMAVEKSTTASEVHDDMGNAVKEFKTRIETKDIDIINTEIDQLKNSNHKSPDFINLSGEKIIEKKKAGRPKGGKK